MRTVSKSVLMLILSFVLAMPVFAAEHQATGQQSKQWDKVAMDALKEKYKGAKEFKDDYVDISNWTVIDVDPSPMKKEDEQKIAKNEDEIEKLKGQAVDAQNKLNYFNGVLEETQDAEYKKEVEGIVKQTKGALNKTQKDIESKEKENQDLAKKEYPTQVATAIATVDFGGSIGTMTYKEKFYVDPATNKKIESADAQKFKEVTKYYDESQPKFEAQTFHYETLGFFFLVLGLGGWWFVTRKF